jgi:hypothetical protein
MSQNKDFVFCAFFLPKLKTLRYFTYTVHYLKITTLYREQSLKLNEFRPSKSRINLFKHNHCLYREQPTNVEHFQFV